MRINVCLQLNLPPSLLVLILYIEKRLLGCVHYVYLAFFHKGFCSGNNGRVISEVFKFHSSKMSSHYCILLVNLRPIRGICGTSFLQKLNFRARWKVPSHFCVHRNIAYEETIGFSRFLRFLLFRNQFSLLSCWQCSHRFCVWHQSWNKGKVLNEIHHSVTFGSEVIL